MQKPDLLFAGLKCPFSERLGGATWFSCAKNCSRSPSLFWQAMNNWENKAASLLAVFSWSTFLRCDENKSELFPLIVDALSENISDRRGLLVGSREDGVVANQNVDLRSLMPCNIEEAHERMFVHVQHAAALYPRILIKTVDSDVVVIALSAFHRIHGLRELWLEFGVGKHLKYIPVHEIAVSLRRQTCNALLFFHAFSDCDTTSSLKG